MKYLFKLLLVCFILPLTTGFISSNVDSDSQKEIVRSGFYQAIQDSKKADFLVAKISKLRDKHPLFQAYHGATFAIMAKTRWNPFSATSLLNKSKEELNAAVKKSPNNIEIRFIRFAVQKNIPNFLGYSENTNEDKTFIINNLDKFRDAKLSKEMKDYVIYFLKEQAGYSSKEIELISLKLSA